MNRRDFLKNLFKLGAGTAGAVGLPKDLLVEQAIEEIAHQTLVNNPAYVHTKLGYPTGTIIVGGPEDYYVFGSSAAIVNLQEQATTLTDWRKRYTLLGGSYD